MGGSRRVLKVEKELRQVIASYLLKGFKGSLKGLVSVTRIQATSDLRNARVFVSVMGSDEDKEISLENLEMFSGDIQKEVNRRLSMKFCPKLHFVLDSGTDNVTRVNEVLQRLKTDGGFGEQED